MLKVFKQETFQGKLSWHRYFEGWYYKHVSSDLEHVYSFIPGISLSEENPHAFVQVIDGVGGQSWYINYDLNQFTWDKKRLYIKVGNSWFTDKGIYLDINEDTICFKGEIVFRDIVQYPKSFLSPGIMGWYSFVPFMECKHSIVSITHNLIGNIAIDGTVKDFTGGKGYIEKDWGKSFPREWLWLHSNTFKNSDASLTVSIANIPWLRGYFIGFIAFLYTGKGIYIFASYNKSRITRLSKKGEGDIIYVTLVNENHKIDLRVTARNLVKLIAPVKGNMTRNIKESIDSELSVSLYDKQGSLIFEDTGRRAGLEVIEKIFECFS